MPFQRHDQIAYVPSHVEGNTHHPNVQFGFITHTSNHGCFCRYWWSKDGTELRTAAKSELTPEHLLVHFKSHTEEQVRAAWERWVPEPW
jgi:hypothetical protein